MPDDAVDPLLLPVSESSPCGADLQYDPVFLSLLEASRGKAEQQYGDHIRAAEEPDWRSMKDEAMSLCQRTRDLRVILLLMRAETRSDGIHGFATGIQRVRGLLEAYWDDVHPQLDANDDDDPTMRLNALGALGDPETVLADLRQSMIGDLRTGLTVRQIEVGLDKSQVGKEGVPTAVGVATALALVGERDASVLAQLVALDGNVQAIQRIVDEKLGAGNEMNLRPLRVLTQTLATAASNAKSETAPAQVASPASASETAAPPSPVATAFPTPARATAGAGTLDSRDDVIRMLDQVCAWIERHEPTNPAPLLIRRGQRLMTKSFIEIVRDLVPDGLKEVERLAGVDSVTDA